MGCHAGNPSLQYLKIKLMRSMEPGWIMRANAAKFILILVLLTGEALGLFMYSRVLSLLAGFFEINWISLILLFVMSVLLFVFGLRILIGDLLETTSLDRINLIKILEFLMGGFISCYVVFSLIGIPMLAIFMLIQKFFI
jgi:hypothetical protein